MLNLIIRTKKSEGNTSLFTRVRIGKQVAWINLRLTVDVSKWRAVEQSNIKSKNYLEKLAHYKKILDVEFAIQELKKHNRLTKENVENVVENVVLSDIRERVIKEKTIAKEVAKRRGNNIKNFLVDYVDGINKGTVRSSNGEKYTPNSVKIWNQFRRVFLGFYDKNPFDWEDINQIITDRFISYLEDDCGYMRSTNERYISLFKTFVRIAENKGIHTNFIAKIVSIFLL